MCNMNEEKLQSPVMTTVVVCVVILLSVIHRVLSLNTDALASSCP